MFSGGDSDGGDGFNSRQQLTNYFTAPTGNIDWASLAQQWIQMQSTGNSQLNDCIPQTSTTCTTKNSAMKSHDLIKAVSSTLEEKGEADMDMDEESDIDRNNEQSSPPPPAPNISSLWYMHQPPQSVPTPAEKDVINPQNTSQWNIWPPQVTMPPPSIANVSIMNPTAHIPSLMKINVANPNSGNSVDDNNEDGAGTSSASINAAKRKKLPAWIREGLEKMEREKQKQLEKEQQNQNVYQDNSPTAVVPNEKELYVKDDMVNEIHISEKKMASESSGNEEEEDNNESAVFTVSKESISSKKKLNNDDRYTDNIQNTRTDKSFEEKMANLMVDVRRTLTELLLEVTNEEISNIAVESLKSCKLKASSAQLIHKVALSSLTGKLGLTAYDDSSSGESSDSSNERSDDNGRADTDEELKVTIRAKHRAFSKISNEIEERLVASAAMEEQKIKYYTNLEQQRKNGKGEMIEVRKRDSDEQDSVSSSSKNMPPSSGRKGYTKEFGETTETKLIHSNGKWQKDRSSLKERTTRFSDNKDSRSKSIATTATYISQIQNTSNVITPNMSTTSLVSTGVQDPNGLYTAANACITKDSNKSKKSEESSSRKRSRSRRRSSSSSSSDSSSSSSSSKKRRRREHSSSSRHRSHKKSDRERNSERRRHKRSYRSSESDDEHYYRRSRHTSNHSRSRSKSRSSYSSTKHRRY